jgi:hypothetical protein
MGQNPREIQVSLSGIYGSKRIAKTWKMMKEVVVQDLTELMEILKKCGVWWIQTVNKAYYVEMLKRLLKALRKKKSLNFSPTIGFSSMTMFQFTGCSLSKSVWPKNRLLIWNTHPTSLIWLGMTSNSFRK